jgi:putative methyltransferase (TIGR04325 family)
MRRVKKLIAHCFGFQMRAIANPTTFNGNFKIWDEALALCSGYSAANIVRKTKAAALAVQKGKALYERDTVLFHDEAYAWQILACLNLVAANAGGQLKVLDFGGSLGSTYFQNRKFLRRTPQVSWCIVEQPELAEFGKAELEDDILRFFSSFDDALQCCFPQVMLFGSVLQYLPDPVEILKEAFATHIPWIIVDRTAFHTGSEDRLTIQHVSPEIYDASYPAWFFSLMALKRRFHAAGYELITEWVCEDDYPLEGTETSFRGMLFRASAL